MALRDRLKKTVRTVIDRLSGEYSAASSEIQEPPPEWNATPAEGAEVKVTRARLKRPGDAGDKD